MGCDTVEFRQWGTQMLLPADTAWPLPQNQGQVHQAARVRIAAAVLHVSLLQRSIGLPDVHSGYGFAIGNMAAFDMNDPEAVVSPGK